MRKTTAIMLSLFSFGIMTAQKKKVKPSYTPPAKKTAPVHFGIKAGVGLNSISNIDEHRNLKNKMGFYGGLFANYALNDKASVQLDALYQHFGASINYKKENKIKGYWQLSHINIPITVQYKIIPQLYAETGPELNINIKSQEVITDKGGYNIKDKADFKDATRTTTFGWNFGLGYFLTDNISANIRYSLGLSSPYKDYTSANGKKTDTSKFRTGNLQLGLAYSF